MKRVNDIFYSLQGEGYNTGRAAVFLRFAGCNLRCPFCDTEFMDYREMSDDDIIAALRSFSSQFVVITGGEPTLQLNRQFVDLLHSHGYEIAIETNGTRPVPEGIDWVTVSPKLAFVGEKGRPIVKTCNELKCIFDGDTIVENYGIKAQYYYLQPCDTGDADKNRAIMSACIAYIKTHPRWRLSLQTHKLVGFK